MTNEKVIEEIKNLFKLVVEDKSYSLERGESTSFVDGEIFAYLNVLYLLKERKDKTLHSITKPEKVSVKDFKESLSQLDYDEVEELSTLVEDELKKRIMEDYKDEDYI